MEQGWGQFVLGTSCHSLRLFNLKEAIRSGWGPTSSGQARGKARPVLGSVAADCQVGVRNWEGGWAQPRALFGMEEPGFQDRLCHSWTLGKSLTFLGLTFITSGDDTPPKATVQIQCSLRPLWGLAWSQRPPVNGPGAPGELSPNQHGTSP